jgi:23S rRNA pseudouridine1911/1915/1917 synthase
MSDLSLAVTVPGALDGERLDKVVSILGDVPRARAAALVAGGLVVLDGDVVGDRSRRVREGQRLEVEIPAVEADLPSADSSVEFPVVFEDEHVVIVDKPAGLVVHHGAGHHGGTLIDGLLARFPDLIDLPSRGAGDAGRPGIVHRLDKGTSGLLAIARSALAFEALTAQLRRRTVGRSYLSLLDGSVSEDRGVVDAPIGRSEREPARMAVARQGRPARTHYEVRNRFSSPFPASYVEARLESGRTHQIRVHLAAIGHPVVGDDRYGLRKGGAERLIGLDAGRNFLHAAYLALDHPVRGRMEWRSDLPEDLSKALSLFA